LTNYTRTQSWSPGGLPDEQVKSFWTLSLPLILGLGLAIILPALAGAQKVRASKRFTAFNGAPLVATDHRSLITAPDAPSNGLNCLATIDGATVYSSTDASAVQDAVDSASEDDTIKVAGFCAGVQTRAGLAQTVYISQNVTIRGGYTTTNWTTTETDWPIGLAISETELLLDINIYGR
jgi:hypothetical protein